MGCGSSKVLPEAPKQDYASVVQSFVAFRKARDEDDDPKKKKKMDHRLNMWFSAKGDKLQLITTNQQQQQQHSGGPRNSAAKYRDKFEPRVTARYDIKALIGRGSFSRVVRVEHRATRQPFAIKMMELEAPEAREVCASELAVLRRVSHANVIQLIEVLQFPQRVYMVLELATGGELLDRVVSKGHFTERDATRALRMVLAGLEYLHHLGITHRDLKPENLLYYHPGADSRLLVTDFGLAALGSTFIGSDVPKTDQTNRKDPTGEAGTWCLRTVCGTPEYLAPEVVLRRPYTCAVDMWAVGVITYIVLSGSMPFEDDSRSRLYKCIVKGKYSFHGKPWPSISDLAKDFIVRLLVLDPTARLTAVEALRHPWVVSAASRSSTRNLHRSISQNLRQRVSRTSSRCPGSSATTSTCDAGKHVGSGRQKSPVGNLEAAAEQGSWTEPTQAQARGHRERQQHPTKPPDSRGS